MREDFKAVPKKAKRVLLLIGFCFFCIFLRVWYLDVVCRDQFVEKAKRPQRREVVVPVERASIVDRFGVPLAKNEIAYQATILYSEVQQLPAFAWEGEKHERKKVSLRRRHVEALADFLAGELRIAPLEIEDAIFAKAALFPHTPYVLKNNLTEAEYSRLRAVEREWPGLKTRVGFKRVYPHGTLAANILGYVGPIDAIQYKKIAGELEELRGYVSEREAGRVPFLPPGYTAPEQVRLRLAALEEKAYSIHDLVGKTGIERMYDEELRGFFGKRVCEIDPKGTFLRELPGGRRQVEGKRIELTISSELQQFAEQLLANYEEEMTLEGEGLSKAPWIKGGAIVVLDPKKGEVLALASSPTYDPGDFVSGGEEVKRWLEQLSAVGELWDGERELQKSGRRKLEMGWRTYLSMILAPKAKVRKVIDGIGSMGEVFKVLRSARALLQLSGQEKMATVIEAIYEGGGHIPSKVVVVEGETESAWLKWGENYNAFSSFREVLDRYLHLITYNDDKLLLLDLLSLLVDIDKCSPELFSRLDEVSPEEYRACTVAALQLRRKVAETIYPLFIEKEFAPWREAHLKDFLAEKRKEEKRFKKFARPYTDYLHEVKQQMWNSFWQEKRDLFLEVFLSAEEGEEPSPYSSLLVAASSGENQGALAKVEKLLKGWTREEKRTWVEAVRSFEELTAPLYGSYKFLREEGGVSLQKHLAAAFYPKGGYGFTKDITRADLLPQGSVFKLVTAYQALIDSYDGTPASLSPLHVLDDLGPPRPDHPRKQLLGFTKEGEMIRRYYKGGMLPRSHPNIGWTDLQNSIEQSTNLYFSLLASEVIRSPDDLNKAATLLGYGEKTGIELPGEVRGSLPTDLSHNKTGLYSYAIGQHTLVVTPLQTISMLTTLADGGKVLRPHIVKKVTGSTLERGSSIFNVEEYPHREALSLLGIELPLFTHELRLKKEQEEAPPRPDIVRTIDFPEPIRQALLDGMNRVVVGSRSTARSSILKMTPALKKRYQALYGQFVGKTGTAEILYKHTLDAETKPEIRNHVWFGGISFSPDQTKEALGKWGEPELIVVVVHRYSKAGREGAPFAAQIVDKWREIELKHQTLHGIKD